MGSLRTAPPLLPHSKLVSSFIPTTVVSLLLLSLPGCRLLPHSLQRNPLKHVSQGMFFCLKPSKHSPPHPEQSPFLLGLTKFMIGLTTPLMPSPTSLPLDYFHPVMRSSLLSFEHAKNSPASGHLHYPFHLPRTLFSQKPHVSLPSSLCSNATSSERFSSNVL